MSTGAVRFRVHFIDGTHIDVVAVNSTAARDDARDRKGGGIIGKIKVLKEGEKK